jgi:hypothetical protein
LDFDDLRFVMGAFMKKYIAILFALLLVLGSAFPVSAQSYSFQLEKMTVDVYWNADGSMALDYFFTFANQPGAHVIDFVDVGLPNSNYTWASINAYVNGESVSVSSDYQGSGTGVAVDLGSRAIQPGQRGVVRLFVGRIERVIYNDDDDVNYASAVFTPTWFGSQYVVGSTDLTVTYHLPPGVQPEEPRWHSAPSGFPASRKQVLIKMDASPTHGTTPMPAVRVSINLAHPSQRHISLKLQSSQRLRSISKHFSHPSWM